MRARKSSADPGWRGANQLQLLDAKAKLDTYLSSSETFLACLKRDEASFGENMDADKKSAIITTYNTVVDEMYLAANEFNVALRKFNHREKP